ncbi:MAG: MBL fold metallo-hydrolase [Clostridia bacterium]|nr:MBL fold metallo-hydrolase [Clostridia bacterium]
MKIQMIGTGSIGAKAFSSCTLIEDKILVDLGNGNVKHMKELGIDPCTIPVVLITHLHGDHFADIPFFLFDKFFKNANEKTVIYCPVGTMKKVEDLFHIIFPGDYEKVMAGANTQFIEFTELKDEEVVQGLFVTSYEVDHGNCKPAYRIYNFQSRKNNPEFLETVSYAQILNKLWKRVMLLF